MLCDPLVRIGVGIIFAATANAAATTAPAPTSTPPSRIAWLGLDPLPLAPVTASTPALTTYFVVAKHAW